MNKTKIEWVDYTWNPITGCDPISLGCDNCYAARLGRRFVEVFGNFRVEMHYDRLDQPAKRKKGTSVFVSSMGDIFHEKVLHLFIFMIANTMGKCPQHTFYILTKRPSRLKDFPPFLNTGYNFPSNCWIGVTVESNKYFDRIDKLRSYDGKNKKFISIEPLLTPMYDIDLTGMDWVIVGGETGPGRRPMKEEWVLDIKDKCEKLKIPFFFKQWGWKKGCLLRCKGKDGKMQEIKCQEGGKV